MLRLLRWTTLALTAACSAAAQGAKPKVPAVPLATAGLAGQPVAVLPLTMVVSDPALPGGRGPAARTALLQWADSVLRDVLSERAPEVSWLFPEELRRIAGRAPGLLPEPDRMGHAVMRNPDFKELPDPLRSQVRQLLALSSGARYALIPASLVLAPAGADSLSVQLSAVLADGRLGRVMWRTLAVGSGTTADQAYRAALATLLPDPAGTR